VRRDYLLLPNPPGVDPDLDDPNNADMPKAKARRALLAVGIKIRDARLAKGWSRTFLARKAQVTVATIRGCETGTKATQLDKLGRIAAAVGTSLKRLETDETADPRVRNWWDEDYVIGQWFHNAPRQLKNRIWALQDTPEAAAALLDPQFLPLLDGWAALTQHQKTFILSNFAFIKNHPDSLSTDVDTGSSDGPTPLDPKTREPHR
jgi:transcriptional regulator with XRE-family HTH domain